MKFCINKAPKFGYHKGTSILTVKGKLEEEEYRDLLRIYPGQNEVHAELKRLRDESQLYLSDNDLTDLDTYAKRIRGECSRARNGSCARVRVNIYCYDILRNCWGGH